MSMISNFPALSPVALAEVEHALDCQAESDAIDAVIQDGLTAMGEGLDARTGFDGVAMAIAANGALALALAFMVAL